MTAGQQPGSGATRRWIVLFLAWLTFLISFVDRLTWGNVALSASRSLAMPIASLGIVVTAFYVGYVVANLIGGLTSDWFGPRKVLAVSITLLGAFTVLFGSVTSLGAAVAVQAAMGLAAGADYAASVKLLTAWFDRRHRGLAMGLLLTASSLGVVVTNAIVPSLLQVLSWQILYRALGVLTIAIGLLSYTLVRDQPVARPTVQPARPNLTVLLRNRNLALLALAGFGAFWGTWGFTFWANALMVRGHGMTPIGAGVIVALFGAGAILGKPLIGLLSDRFNGVRKLPIIACLVAFSLMLIVFGQLTTEFQFRIAAPVLGMAAFVYSPLMGAMVAETAGLEVAGSATGLTSAIWQTGNVIVPIVIGFAYQSTASFDTAFLILAAGPALAALCMIFTREQFSSFPEGAAR